MYSSTVLLFSFTHTYIANEYPSHSNLTIMLKNMIFIERFFNSLIRSKFNSIVSITENSLLNPCSMTMNYVFHDKKYKRFLEENCMFLKKKIYNFLFENIKY